MAILGLKLKNHKALKECKLENLGKINVICGKNSSGKTTLLESIKIPDSCLVGVSIEVLPVERLVNEWNKSISNAPDIHAKNMIYPFSRIFQQDVNMEKVLNNAFLEDRILYSDELLRFSEDILEKSFDYINKDLDTHRLKAAITVEASDPSVKPHFIERVSRGFYQVFTEIVNSRFPDDQIAYLNPKRAVLEDVKTLNLQVTDDGTGLLKKLHSLKNNLSGSASRSLYEILSQKFSEVSTNYKFDVAYSEHSLEEKLFFSVVGKDDWRTAENWGLGLQDLLFILYYALEPKTKLILIEEPENHLHPELQRRLLQFLKEETLEDKQFFLSTHSNIFLDDSYVDRIFHTTIQNEELLVDDATNRSRIMNDLGYSTIDNLISDLVIVVEGVNDRKVLIEFLKENGFVRKI